MSVSAGDGAKMFLYYQDLIHFSSRHTATRSQEIDIIHALGENRLIAFTRSAGADYLLVVASLRNQPFLDGYIIQTDASRLPDGSWREVFNSDAANYGGNNIGNFERDCALNEMILRVMVLHVEEKLVEPLLAVARTEHAVALQTVNEPPEDEALGGDGDGDRRRGRRMAEVEKD